MEFIDIDIGEDEREEILEKYTKLVLEPYDHIATYPKNKVKELLFVTICSYWFDLTNEQVDIISSCFFQLHNVSLLIDDICDSSVTRRGAPASHIIYGPARTIAACHYIVDKTVFENIPRHLQVPIRQWLALVTQRGIKGNIMETYWRDKCICPTEEEYIDMVNKKAGVGFLLIFCISMEFSAKKGKDYNTLEALAQLLGLHFQLRDDYYNLKSEKYFKEKGFCEDITEGKFSYPMVCALRNHPEDRRIIEILKMNTMDDAIKTECVELIDKYGGFKDTRNKLSILPQQIFNEIKKLGGHPMKDAWLQMLDFEI